MLSVFLVLLCFELLLNKRRRFSLQVEFILIGSETGHQQQHQQSHTNEILAVQKKQMQSKMENK